VIENRSVALVLLDDHEDVVVVRNGGVPAGRLRAGRDRREQRYERERG